MTKIKNITAIFKRDSLFLELKKLLKSKDISEDDEKKFEKTIQIHTDNYIKLIDEKVLSKEKEIMTI